MSEVVDTQDSAIEPPSGRSARSYNRWTKNATLEDYSLRYAPRSFRTWTPYVVATTALGGIAYLADFAIGGSIAITHGFSSAVTAILVAAVVIFITGTPIAYYSAKYAIDMDLLTRGAGFGYLGSTLTSLIYASFTFIFFALEGSIMAQAFELGLHIPLAIGYLIASLVIIPLVIFGMTALSKLQVWTQPIWLVLMFVGFGVYTPTLRDQIRVLESEGPGSEEYQRLSARGRTVGIVLGIIVVVIVFLMVTKPG